ncbi:MAG: class I SAM-dependent methyltransferase [Clostridiales bacterium]|nr:class I SAM-dependent methyltransferase [Clostridiales bacterium]
MAHKFHGGNFNRLDNEERRREMPPYETLERLGYKSGMDMADIGCGIGYFSIPAADISKDSSKVYAMDILAEMLEEVEKRASAVGLTNIVTVMVEEYDMKLAAESVDFVLLCNVLHEIDDKKRYMVEIKRILRSGGILAIIDYEKVQGTKGPPLEHRISCDEVAELLSDNGLGILSESKLNEDSYSITAKKNQGDNVGQ